MRGRSRMKRSVKIKIMAGLSMMAVTACWNGTEVYAAYDKTTNTDTLTNQMVSQDRGNVNAGDFKSYDHADRNLVINWTDNSRLDGSAIRNSTVNAKNLTIDTNFEGNQWTDKGVISDIGEDTHITAGNQIDIKAHDDAVYVSGDKSKVTIDGFKKLTITSTGEGYGLVDTGGGITVKGGADSTVDISAPQRPAIGNTIKSLYMVPKYFLGTGVSITAGKKITLGSPTASVFTGINKNNDFKITLDAPEIELNGSVSAAGGTTQINGSDVTIHSSTDPDFADGYSISAFGNDGNKPTQVSINENTSGRVRLYGGISNGLNSQVTVNMTDAGSFITTEGETDKEWESSKRMRLTARQMQQRPCV